VPQSSWETHLSYWGLPRGGPAPERRPPSTPADCGAHWSGVNWVGNNGKPIMPQEFVISVNY